MSPGRPGLEQVKPLLWPSIASQKLLSDSRGPVVCLWRAVGLSGRGRESGDRRQPPTAGYFCPPITKRPSSVSQTCHAWASPGFVLKCRLQTENADSFFGAGVQLETGFLRCAPFLLVLGLRASWSDGAGHPAHVTLGTEAYGSFSLHLLPPCNLHPFSFSALFCWDIPLSFSCHSLSCLEPT